MGIIMYIIVTLRDTTGTYKQLPGSFKLGCIQYETPVTADLREMLFVSDAVGREDSGFQSHKGRCFEIKVLMCNYFISQKGNSSGSRLSEAEFYLFSNNGILILQSWENPLVE